MTTLVPIESIISKIIILRGEKALLDRDLAVLYGVETKALKQAVRRNAKRFPGDFLFELTEDEFQDLRSQIVTSSWGGTRYPPMAFTEQGVAMLSSVLKSDRAIDVNIAIMRAFVILRKMLATNEDLARRIEALEKKYDRQFKIVFDAIFALMDGAEKENKKIGFVKEPKVKYGKRAKST